MAQTLIPTTSYSYVLGLEFGNNLAHLSQCTLSLLPANFGKPYGFLMF